MPELPITFYGLVNLFAGLWAVAAYAAAAVAGVRTLRAIVSPGHVPAFPMCLIAAATCWLFSRRRKSTWSPCDFFVFSTFILTAASLISAASAIDFLAGLDWRKLGHFQSLQRFGADILTGSALIVLFAGVNLQYARSEKNDCLE